MDEDTSIKITRKSTSNATTSEESILKSTCLLLSTFANRLVFLFWSHSTFDLMWLLRSSICIQPSHNALSVEGESIWLICTKQMWKGCLFHYVMNAHEDFWTLRTWSTKCSFFLTSQFFLYFSMNKYHCVVSKIAHSRSRMQPFAMNVSLWSSWSECFMWTAAWTQMMQWVLFQLCCEYKVWAQKPASAQRTIYAKLDVLSP